MTINPHLTTVPVGELGTRRADPPVPGQPRRVSAAVLPAPGADGVEKTPADAAAVESSAAKSDALASSFPLQELSIRRDPEIGRVVVQVLDAETGEVVRQIPSEEWVSVLKRLRGAKGLFVDRKE